MNELLPGTFNYWFLQTLAMGLTALLIPKLRITSVFGALITVVSLALINATIWDAALFLSVPDAFSTQAIVLLLTNGIIFWVLVKLLPGIEVDGILPALAAPVVFTVVSLVISEHGRDVDWVAVVNTVIGALERLREFLVETPTETPPPAAQGS